MGKRILVVGGGGREHALLWKLARSSRLGSLICAPGNAGTADLAANVPIPVTDLDGMVELAQRERVDLVVVGPEEPLARGLADRLVAAGVPVFGPTAAAARIESSKAWAKEVMLEAGVPTARSITAADLSAGISALAQFSLPVVIKADGLAAGKGVVVAETRDEALLALTALLDDGVLGEAGRTVLIEEFLTGHELSVFGVTDGSTVLPLTPARDHKRAYDGDAGPNTGGMGACAPAEGSDGSALERIRESILEPTVRAMAARGVDMRGVLYAGLMMTSGGPKVLEFNARFGDPEIQVILPLLDLDLVEVCDAVATGRLASVAPAGPTTGAAVGVVVASGGYPGPYRTGLPIAGLDSVPEDVLLFHAGTRRESDGQVVTHGGRVLTVVGQGSSIAEARERAYAGVDAIAFDGAHARRDIAIGT